MKLYTVTPEVFSRVRTGLINYTGSDPHIVMLAASVRFFYGVIRTVDGDFVPFTMRGSDADTMTHPDETAETVQRCSRRIVARVVDIETGAIADPHA